MHAVNPRPLKGIEEDFTPAPPPRTLGWWHISYFMTFKWRSIIMPNSNFMWLDSYLLCLFLLALPLPRLVKVCLAHTLRPDCYKLNGNAFPLEWKFSNGNAAKWICLTSVFNHYQQMLKSKNNQCFLPSDNRRLLYSDFTAMILKLWSHDRYLVPVTRN